MLIAMSIRDRLYLNWGWVVVLTSWIIFIVMFGIVFSYGLFFVEFQKDFQSSATLTGWAGAIPIAFTLLLAPPMQVIIDRFGYRPVGVTSLVLASAGVVATSFVPNILFVYLTYSLVFGCGAGSLTFLMMSLIVQYFPSKNCVRALALAFSGSSVAMLSFPPLITFLFDRVGWRNTLRILGSFYFIVCIPCVTTFVSPSSDRAPSPRDPEQNAVRSQTVSIPTEAHEDDCIHSSLYHPSDNSNGDEKTKSSSEEHDPDISLLRRDATGNNVVFNCRLEENKDESLKAEMLSDDSKNNTLRQRLCQAMTYPELWIISIAVIITGVLDCFFYVNMVSYMISVGFTESDGARVLSVIGGSTLVGKLSLSLGGELLPFPSYYLLVMSSLLSIGVLAALLFVRNMGTMLFLAAVIGGLMVTTTNVVIMSIPASFFGPKRVRQTMPVIYFCNGIGFMCGSLVGQSIDRTGSYRIAILISIGVYIFVTCLFIAAPLYQRTFAPDRYVVQKLHRINRSKK